MKIVRAALDAFNRGDWEAMVKHAAADCEFDWSRSIGPQRGIYRLEQFPEFNLAETFESVRFDPEELIEGDEHVVTPLIGSIEGRDGIARRHAPPTRRQRTHTVQKRRLGETVGFASTPPTPARAP